MYDEARLLNASGGGDPVPKGQCLAIGDRLDTADMALPEFAAL